MKRFLLIAALLAICTLAIAAPPLPKFPSKYSVKILLSLPYAHINEPITVTYDADAGREQISLYEGIDATLYRDDLNKTFETYPRLHEQACFVGVFHQSPPALVSFFPDFSSGWVFNREDRIDGIEVDVFSLNQTRGVAPQTKDNYYEFSVVRGSTSRNSPIPVRFEARYGYNIISGSHYDHYVFTYFAYFPNIVDEVRFIVPEICQKSDVEVREEPVHRLSFMLRSIMPATSEAEENDNHVDLLFNQFQEEHGKKYSSVHEYHKRRQNFAKNVAMIQAHNARTDVHHKLRVNRYADWSMEEFRKVMLPKRGRSESSGAHGTHVPKMKLSDAPSSWDWRDHGLVGPVLDQGVCGSCWAFSAAQAIAGAHAKATGQLISLSPQMLVDCAWVYPNNQGCDGGNEWDGFRWAIEHGGLPSLEDLPYKMANMYCQTDVRRVAHISKYYNTTAGDENALLQAVAENGPVSVAIAVQDSLIFYNSGVYYEPNCPSDAASLDHAVLVVGYGTDAKGGDYWIVKNSWSTHWGDEGYVYMARNRKNNCGIATVPNFPVV